MVLRRRFRAGLGNKMNATTTGIKSREHSQMMLGRPRACGDRSGNRTSKSVTEAKSF